MDKLTIKAEFDEATVGLTGKLSVGGFSGHGEAWFNSSDVIAFCDQLNSLASQMSGKVEIIGDHQKADGTEYLELLALRCYVLSASKLNGVIGIYVSISHPPYSDCREEEIQKVAGELQARNGQVREFSVDLRKLVEGKRSEATIYGDLTRF